MSREFEIKLEIPTSAVDKVMRLPWLWEMASGELRAAHLASTYYDTPGFALRERGVTLRVRRVGAKCLQTLKAAAGGLAVPIERDEWEEEIQSEEPELKLLAGTPLGAIPRRKLRRKLQPQFEVQIDRSAFPIQSANSAMEVAIDRARVLAADGTASFCEIELELKRGASSELARVARRIASEIPAALALSTKADRGFALLEGATPCARPAEPIRLDSSALVGEAFQAIGWSCLRHIALNIDAVAFGEARAVRELRSGLRRLAAALSVFKRMLDGPETDSVRAELEWLADELGPAREIDAFVEETLIPLRSEEVAPTDMAALCDDVLARRNQAMDRARAAVSSERCRQLVLRIALWLIAAEWSDAAALGRAHPNRPVGPFAARALSRLAKRAASGLASFAALGSEARKKLRARLRRLHYAIEFFADIAEPRRQRTVFLATLRQLLSDLGGLSEFAAHERLSAEFMATWMGEDAAADKATAKKAFALGFVIGRQRHEKTALIGAIEKRARRLSRAAPRWRAIDGAEGKLPR